jgi:hypothetical protein
VAKDGESEVHMHTDGVLRSKKHGEVTARDS